MEEWRMQENNDWLLEEDFTLAIKGKEILALASLAGMGAAVIGNRSDQVISFALPLATRPGLLSNGTEVLERMNELLAQRKSDG